MLARHLGQVEVCARERLIATTTRCRASGPKKIVDEWQRVTIERQLALGCCDLSLTSRNRGEDRLDVRPLRQASTNRGHPVRRIPDERDRAGGIDVHVLDERLWIAAPGDRADALDQLVEARNRHVSSASTR